jgi:5-formyltetrahydrofolate cyclo-ligase
MRALSFDNRICVPVIAAPGAPLRFREWWPGCPLKVGAHGVPVPSDGAWRVPHVAIIPLLGFDAAGRRLGQGGGFYDRTLAVMPELHAVGLAVEAQRLDHVPTGPHDRPLREIVTEAGVHRAAPPV